MIISNELKKRERFESDVNHASALTGKLRVIVFNVVGDGTETQALIAKLPAGRGRLLPGLSRFAVDGVSSVTVSLNFDTYKSSDLSVGDVAAGQIAAGATAATGSQSTWTNVATAAGWAYNSLEDVPVYVQAGSAITEGATITGFLVFVAE